MLQLNANNGSGFIMEAFHRLDHDGFIRTSNGDHDQMTNHTEYPVGVHRFFKYLKSIQVSTNFVRVKVVSINYAQMIQKGDLAALVVSCVDTVEEEIGF